MEEYLQYMKSLRSHMNDVEDQATKTSVEEQTQFTTIHTLENDIVFAKSEMKRLKEVTEEMEKAKGQICSQILERQKKIASLEYDSSTLTQSLELIQQEKVTLSAKHMEKRAQYNHVSVNIKAKLVEQQEWINSQGLSPVVVGPGHEAGKNMMAELRSTEAKLGELSQQKSKLLLENNKVKDCIEQTKCRINNFKPELMMMDISKMEDEEKALLYDKTAEMEFLQSLQQQIAKLKVAYYREMLRHALFHRKSLKQSNAHAEKNIRSTSIFVYRKR